MSTLKTDSCEVSDFFIRFKKYLKTTKKVVSAILRRLKKYFLNTTEVVSDSPVITFFAGVIFTMVTVTGLWLLALYIVSLTSVENVLFNLLPGSGNNIDKTPISLGDIFGSSTNLTSVIIGTSVAVASAFVAVLVAKTGSRAALAALEESRLNNKFNSPDYLAMKSGVEKIVELSFLNNALIYAYNAYKDLILLDESYQFKPDTVLINRLSELVASPQFSTILNQAAELKSDVEGLGEKPVYDLHKRIAHLIVRVKAIQEDTDLHAYQAKLLFAVASLRKSIDEISWSKYANDYKNGNVSPELKNALIKYPVVGHVITENIPMPSWSFDPTIVSAVRLIYGQRRLKFLANVKRVTLALFPQLAGAVFNKYNFGEALEENKGKYHALLSWLFSQGGKIRATDGVVVRVAPGDTDALSSLLVKAKEEAKALGMEPYEIDLTNYHIGDYNDICLIEDIKKIKSSGKRLLLITVVSAQDHIEKLQDMGLKLTNHLRYVDQIVIVRDFNQKTNIASSSNSGIFKKEDEQSPEDKEVNKLFDNMSSDKLNSAVAWYKTETRNDIDEVVMGYFKKEAERRNLIERYLSIAMPYNIGSLSLIAVVAENINNPVKFGASTICGVLDSLGGGYSNDVIGSDLTKIIEIPDPLEVDNDFIKFSREFTAAPKN